MSSDLDKKPEKGSSRKSKPTVNDSVTHTKRVLKINLKFVIRPDEKRAQYVKTLDKMIRRVERIINAGRTKTRQRLRAMTVLTELVRASYSMVRDAEIEQLELEVKELETEESEAPETKKSPE